MLSDEQLQAIMPDLPAARRARFLPFLQAAMTEFSVDRPAREAAFVAQLAHESGQFRFMEEIWGPTDQQRRYEPTSDLSARLGNTEPGDGKRFKGRGPIQITGRANYQRFGGLLGVDLVAEPERAALPELAFRIAGLFWMKKGLNELADVATSDAFREITRRINGGFNGLKDRERFYNAARAVLGVRDAPASRGPSRGGSRGIPGDEPDFDRGHEAIRAYAPKRRRARKPAARKRQTMRRKTSPKKTSTRRRQKSRRR
jgi:putative chitinase